MDYILEFVKSTVGRVILIAIGLLVLLGILYGVFSPSAEERLEQAQTSVNALFVEDRDQVLRADVSEEEMETAQKAVNRLSDEDSEAYQAIIEDAKGQYDALQVTSAVFEGNTLKSDQPPLIKEGVTPDQLSQLHSQIDSETTPYKDKVKNQLNQALEMIPAMDELKVKIDDFASQQQITRGNLYDVVLLSNTMTEDAIHYANQPYLATHYSDFTQAMDNLADSILNGYSYGAYEQLTLDEIFANPILSD